MADDKATAQRRDDTASVSDSDFVVESHSVSNAFAEPPADTTEDRATVAQLPEEAVVKDDMAPPTEQREMEAPPDESHPERQPASQPKPKTTKKDKSLDGRTVQLKHEVDVLTHAKHRTKSEVEAAERQLGDLKQQIAAHEAKARGGAPAETPSQSQTDSDPPMPAFPDYRTFATDEEYETAKGKYHADLMTWQRGHSERLEKRLTAGLESRFKDVGEETQFAAAVQRLEVTRNKVRDSKPDWNEKAANLQELQSSWYDPTRHGDAKTPFLSDLTRTLLMAGNEEGGELLYWLGEDLDRAQALADLFPTRPIRDALLHASSVIPLLEHFATDEGAREFEALKQMHPVRVNQAIGALSVRLTSASSGSLVKSHPITMAHPSARPPAGTPGARSTTVASAGKLKFDDWMTAEDARERKERERLAGMGAR